MKKFFLFAALALLAMSCDKTEVLNVDNGLTSDSGIKFEAYTPQTAVTKAGTPGDVTNDNIGNLGFGVFAYYTAGEKYDVNAKPNFMYNQKVYKESATATVWKYEPVKYWPNEYGNAAVSDEIDYVTFFSYAPWTEFEPTTGAVVADNEHDQNFNIISVNKNNVSGDPIIQYVVDTDPATSVDLLWGVAASNAASNYSSINEAQAPNKIEAGMPFKDLVKPGNPIEDKISFNLKHALAKVKFTIDYIADDFTPNGTSKVINADETRIFVRSFTIDGWATQGALNLNNEKAGEPLWKDIDGIKDLSFDQLTFNDGRKDLGKEGTENGAQTNEPNQYLNPKIVENFDAVSGNKFGSGKNPGVTNVPQLLFGGDEEKNGGFFYVIPRNEKNGAPVNVKIVYDVETIDPALPGLLSDGMTHGISIENIIQKEAILGDKTDFEAGKQYLVKIHIGMTSVKIEAVVTAWDDQGTTEVDLPDNQPMPCWTVDGVPGYFLSDPSLGIDFTLTDASFVTDSASFVKAITTDSPWKNYYDICDNGNTGDGTYTRYGGEPYSLARAERFNKSLGIHAAAWNVIKTAAEWESAGFVRCWEGVLTDPITWSGWPQFGLDLNSFVLVDGATAEVSYDGAVKHTIDYAWYTEKMQANEPYAIYGPADLGHSQNTATSGNTFTSDFDKEKVTVKLTYPAAKVKYHETIK